MAAQKSEEFDTVIIGGGIIGCSIAYHLACAGNSSVLLLERNALASGATSRAAALLTQVRAKAGQTPLVLRTHAAISELQEEVGDSLGLRRTGSLHVAATPESHEELVRLGRIAEQYGISFAWLDRSEAERRVPWLNAGMATGLVLMPPDGQFVIGPVPHLDGYLVASGCCGGGIAVSGGIGLAIAELVAGRQGPLDLEPFRADRFGAVDPSSQEFRARCAATRSAKTSG